MKLSLVKKILKAVNANKKFFSSQTDYQLKKRFMLLKRGNHSNYSKKIFLIEGIAILREVIYRKTKIFAYDSQIEGALHLIEGGFSQMKTGEGKTIVILFPVFINFLYNRTPYVICSNSYLTYRDGIDAEKIFSFFDITVGIRVGSEQEDINKIYNKDIIYVTSYTLGFDYLNQNVRSVENAVSEKIKFDFAIVDEADLVLLDNANNPLVISGNKKPNSLQLQFVRDFVSLLINDRDYKYSKESNNVRLTDNGQLLAEDFFGIDKLTTLEYRKLLSSIILVLRAEKIFKLDYDYTVQDGKIVLLDKKLGRISKGTRLQHGQHRALEVVNDLKETEDSKSIATITYQTLFKKFDRLSGVSGTLKTNKNELNRIYNAPVFIVPPHKKSKRIDRNDIYIKNTNSKLKYILSLSKKIQAQKRAMLIVCESIDESEIIYKYLIDRHISCTLLNANNDYREAQIIKDAGQVGRITISTPMAGRGTDIKLTEEVRNNGGLFVLASQHFENDRIDEQVRGRAGRQGDRGDTQFLISPNDQIFKFNSFFIINKIKKMNLPLVQVKISEFLIKSIQNSNKIKAYNTRFQNVQLDSVISQYREKVYSNREKIMMEQDGSKLISFVSMGLENAINNDEHIKNVVVERNITAFGNYFSDFNDNLFNKLMMEKVDELNKLCKKDDLLFFLKKSIIRAIDSNWAKYIEKQNFYKKQMNYQISLIKNPLFRYKEDMDAEFKIIQAKIFVDSFSNIVNTSINKFDEYLRVTYIGVNEADQYDNF